MSSWLKVLLLALVALVLPWDGIRYARQMESALRESERQSLRSVADTVAASLQGRAALLYRYPGTPARGGPYDLTAVPLPAPLSVEGAAGWVGAGGGGRPYGRGAWRHYGKAPHRFAILAGVYGRMLYVLLKVQDPRVVFDAPFANPLRRAAMGDRIWLGYAGPRGGQHAEFFALTGPGPIVARRIVTGEYGRRQAIIDPRIVGSLQLRAGGYDVEFSMPLSLIDGRFGVLIDDRDRRGAAPLSYGTLSARTLRTRGRLILASPALPKYLARFVKPGLRLSVTTPAGAMLAQADELTVPRVPAPQPGILARLYHRLVGPHGVRVIETTAPIYGAVHGPVIARLLLTRISDRGVWLRNRTLERMLNVTLATSALAFIAAAGLAAHLAGQGWGNRRRRRAG
jgi:hypothetical protein